MQSLGTISQFLQPSISHLNQCTRGFWEVEEVLPVLEESSLDLSLAQYFLHVLACASGLTKREQLLTRGDSNWQTAYVRKWT